MQELRTKVERMRMDFGEEKRQLEEKLIIAEKEKVQLEKQLVKSLEREREREEKKREITMRIHSSSRSTRLNIWTRNSKKQNSSLQMKVETKIGYKKRSRN
jgi:hypothetical protein